jgi:hypothetical protein
MSMTTRTSPVIDPTRMEIRIAIDKIIAVGDSPCSMMRVGSIGEMGGIDWLAVVN